MPAVGWLDTIAAPPDGKDLTLGSEQLGTELLAVLHAPVVTRGDDGTDRVFASASSAETGSLALFSNSRKGAGPEKPMLTEIWRHPASVKWGQLVPNPARPGSFYALRRNGAASYEGVAVQIGSGSGTPPVSMRVVAVKLPNVGDVDGSAWTTEGRPVVDGEGALILWSGDMIQVWGDTNRDILMLPPPRLAAGRLLFDTNGLLYAQTTADQVLYNVISGIK